MQREICKIKMELAINNLRAYQCDNLHTGHVDLPRMEIVIVLSCFLRPLCCLIISHIHILVQGFFRCGVHDGHRQTVC